MLTRKSIGLIAGPLVFLLTLFFFQPEGLNETANAVLAVTLWMAIWWITEAIPLEVTSLLPLILFPLSGAMSLQETGASYGHKFIFLFVGGFILAIAIEKWNLHKRIALHIILRVGSNLSKIMLGFMLSTALLSMWISNTATTVMMLPIGMAVIGQFGQNMNQKDKAIFAKALMLSIAYSASIGGMATLIGTPPNLIFAGVVQELYAVEISFFQWFLIGFPVSTLLLFIAWVYLSRFAFPIQKIEFKTGTDLIQQELEKLGKITVEEKVILAVFSLTALCWILRPFLLTSILPQIDDSIIALIAATLLFILPSRESKTRLMSWDDAVQLPWGILLLFGGGIALAAGFDTSGLAHWLGLQLNAFQGISLFLLIIVIVSSINFLTEITSNIATTAIFLPVLAVLAQVIQVHPFLLLAAATLAASCAFMLPVATAPNALVFGSRYLSISDMIKSGLGLNVISIIILVVFSYFCLPLFWDIVLMTYPF